MEAQIASSMSLVASFGLLGSSLYPWVAGEASQVDDVNRLSFGVLALVVALASTSTDDANVQSAGQTLASVLLITYACFFDGNFSLDIDGLPTLFCVFPLAMTVFGMLSKGSDDGPSADDSNEKPAASQKAVARKSRASGSNGSVTKRKSRSPTPKRTTSSKKSPKSVKVKKAKSPSKKKRSKSSKSKSPSRKPSSSKKTPAKKSRAKKAAALTPAQKRARKNVPKTGVYFTKIKWGAKKYDGWIDFGDKCKSGKNKGAYEFHFSGYEDQDLVTWVHPEEMKDPLDAAEFSDDE